MSETIPCEHCGAGIPAGSGICLYCGSPAPGSKPPVGDMTPAEQQDTSEAAVGISQPQKEPEVIEWIEKPEAESAEIPSLQMPDESELPVSAPPAAGPKKTNWLIRIGGCCLVLIVVLIILIALTATFLFRVRGHF